MDYFRQAWAIAWKDILSELRTRQMISSVLLFCLLVMVIFSFTFDPGAEYVSELVPGILWVAFCFAGTLGLERSWGAEQENRAVDGLLLSPMDRSAIFLGKALGNLVFMLAVELVTFPLAAVLFGVSFLDVWGKVALVAVLATAGFMAVGTLLSAITVNTKLREILLPILLFPILVPVILAAVKSTGSLLQGEGWEGISSWVKLLAAFDVIFITVAILTFEYVVEE